ncbi:Ppx/GppA family phosphatase [Adlercreutzia faecimuris]|uniref:Ppx/GppA family phosphatase n=1 Tax=Adlercreutzia faecimuris TaxID=2897341 RepID=A0ABS9WIS7_9ACTN|nr:Ppx/GppA family phosphatase [Adlercreutzia sp. JBNU-10]MCI2242783.1 Ppx/GppA family phosphatase [Adlercreutzia sp. JBNU-10]
MGYRPGRYAAIDIGTVTCRMLVADVDASGAIAELDKEYAITNLGEGVDASGVLAPAAMARVLAAVDRYVAVRDALAEPGRPVTTIAMATSAARDAANAAEFAALLAECGVTLAVIPGEREAALSFLGASSDFPDETVAVVDIGGGSTEVVAGRAGAVPAMAHSFNVGCRRVTERFFRADPPSADELAAARAWVRDEMGPFFARLRADVPVDRLIAVAGTATTVVSVREAMASYDSARVHRAFVSADDLRAVAARLEALPLAERERVVGLDPGRAPVIVAGMVILEEVLAQSGRPGFTVSESDILHGMVLEAARA